MGIAGVITLLARHTQVHQSVLAGHVTPYDPQVQEAVGALSGRVTEQQAYGLLYGELVRQSAVLAYADNFRLLAGLAAMCIPLLLLFRKVRRRSG